MKLDLKNAHYSQDRFFEIYQRITKFVSAPVVGNVLGY